MPNPRPPQRRQGAAQPSASPDIEQAIDRLIEEFDPEVSACIRACRAELRHQLPGAFELVYDNYNFFVIGFCPTERPSDCIVSIAASANGVALSFYRGAEVEDPDLLLQGEGKQNRFVRLSDVEALRVPGVRTLVQNAASLGPPLTPGRGTTILRSVSTRQRPRRRNATG